MFVGQQVFYTNDGVTRLARVQSCTKDIFETKTSKEVPQSIAVDTLLPRDCVLHRHDVRPTDTFVAPGLCVGQTGNALDIRRPCGVTLSTHTRPVNLSHLWVDTWGKRCFGLDCDARLFLYIFGIDQASTHEHFVKIRPKGWLHVPTTMSFVCWNSTKLYMVDLDHNRELTLPQKAVRTAAVANDGSLCVTGDRGGQVCVWYTSSWQCHHSLHLFEQAVEQCAISSSGHAAARTCDNIILFDTTTGVTASRIRRHTNACCYTGPHLVVSTGDSIEVYVDGRLTMAFKYTSVRLYASRTDTRVWSVHGDCVTELRLVPESTAVTWPQECLDWIQSPSFPFEHGNWPAPRYMNVLAAAVDEWLPRLTSFDFPKTWMRHGGLRFAIWDACLKHMPEDMERLSTRWQFLESHVLKLCEVKCIQYLEARMGSFEWDDCAVAVLEYIYRRTTTKSDILKRWCWFHHGHPRIQAVLLKWLEKDHDHSWMAIAAMSDKSPDAILCMTPKAISNGLRAGYVSLYIRWLEAFHRAYARAPTQHMRQIFAILFEHIYSKLSTSNLDVPLTHSGTWRCLHPTPAHAGTYVRDTATGVTGFVEKVELKPGTPRKVHWLPNRRIRAIALVSKADELEYWTWSHSSPRTLLECALYLLHKETLTQTKTIRPWTWFESKVGAMLCVGRRILVFDKPMRIRSAEFDQGACTLRTSSHMTITSSERTSIEIEEPTWCYMDDHRHRILPMECKVVRLLNSITRTRVLDLAFASDLLGCCRSKMLDIEHVWFPKREICATMTHDAAFFAGFANGLIYEYEHVSVYAETIPVRTFQAHEEAVLELQNVGEKMLSLSRDMMGIWCLLTGMLMHRYESMLGLHSLVLVPPHRAWIVENDVTSGACPLVTLWDIEFEQALDTLSLPLSATSALHYWTVHCGEHYVLLLDKRAFVWRDREVDHVSLLDVIGDITCVTTTDTMVVGGTTKGTLFIFDVDTDAVEQWSASTKAALISITHVDGTEFIVTGNSQGQLSVWNAVNKNFGVCLYISDSSITYLHAHGNLVLAVTDTAVHVMSVIPFKCASTCLLLHNVLQWSHAWKTAVLRKSIETIQPCVVSCLLGQRHVEHALDLADMCTEEYNDRAAWCHEKMIDVLLSQPLERSRRIIRKIAAYRGHRIDCVICNDCDSKDTVSYITHCQHRFHTKCLKKLIKKTPEWHEEMQYEYALQVPLKCPTCRVEFQPSDVKLDHFLNQHLEH